MFSDFKIDLSNYEKENIIGQGRSSQVFRIKEKKTGQIYAAKIFLGKFDEMQGFETMILFREILYLLFISHPLITELIGISITDFVGESRPVVISEYLPNGSLMEVLLNEKSGQSPENWNDTKKLINIYGIAAGMSFLHSRNIIHRDLCPNNILETSQFYPKICDLYSYHYLSGIFDQLGDNKRGTMFYNAPEVISNSSYNSKSDVYSFGMTVYTIMTNKLPFEDLNDSYYLILTEVIKGKRPELDKNVPERYRKLIEECWSEDPHSRPNFKEIVQQLKGDNEFITEKVNKDEYYDFICFIESLGIDSIEKERKGEKIKKESNFEEEEEKLIEKADKNNVEKEEETRQNIEVPENNVDEKTELNEEVPKNNVEKDEEMKEIELRDMPFFIDTQNLKIKEFKQKEKIGYGTFGSVYKVTDEASGKMYAAKVMKNEFYERFKNTKNGIYLMREVTILSHIKYPSIMEFVGYSPIDFKDTFRPTIITEYMSNGSLEDVLKIEREGHSISAWNDTMRLINIYGIASALKYLHSIDIIHRDLKPENILLDEYLLPKLSDFGFAKSLSQEENKNYKQIHSDAIGTPSFIAPEIYEDDLFLKAGDVYSFALVVYEIMTKLIPFENLNEYQIQVKIVNNERPKFINEIPNVYKELIEECWNQDPNKRPTFNEIVNKLKSNRNFISSTNVNENLYRFYIELIEGDSSKIRNFCSCSLQQNYQEYRTEREYQTGPGLIDLSKLFNAHKIEVFHGQLFSYKKYEISNKFYTFIMSNNYVDFTKDQKDKIVKEVFKMCQMKHPAIQQFESFSFSNFKKKRKPTIICEFLRHVTLFDIINNQRRMLNNTNKIIIIYGIASAMSFLHENEIKNPYLNPMNVVIDEKLNAKLSEIGIHFQFLYLKMQSTRSSFVNKIPNLYFSPELSLSNNVTEKSDVYSFALIVWSIINNKILSNKNDVVLDLNKKMPDVYRELFDKCTQREPSMRPSFSSIVEQLETDERFIRDDVNVAEYKKYIRYVKSGILSPTISQKTLEMLNIA